MDPKSKPVRQWSARPRSPVRELLSQLPGDASFDVPSDLQDCGNEVATDARLSPFRVRAAGIVGPAERRPSQTLP
jgi:hypothetical protein